MSERCPDCEAPLRRPGYCHACGWDGEAGGEEAYLDGVDLPDEVGYEEILARERLQATSARRRPAGASSAPALVVLLLALGALLGLALLGRR